MNCPCHDQSKQLPCGAHSEVLEMRIKAGQVFRRRVCAEGHRFITTETLIKKQRSANAKHRSD
jgi:hypothetical protein